MVCSTNRMTIYSLYDGPVDPFTSRVHRAACGSVRCPPLFDRSLVRRRHRRSIRHLRRDISATDGGLSPVATRQRPIRSPRQSRGIARCSVTTYVVGRCRRPIACRQRLGLGVSAEQTADMFTSSGYEDERADFFSTGHCELRVGDTRCITRRRRRDSPSRTTTVAISH